MKYISSIKKLIPILSCFLFGGSYAQENPATKKEETYYKKEEIVHDGKLYRVHNNYLTAGAGFMTSDIRDQVQKTIGVDFQFPIQKLHFQAGVLMSGDAFTSNNTVQAHICYGLRKENERTNIAAFIGPSLFTGVQGDASGDPEFYQGVGGYVSFQVVAKVKYDVGVGAELFGEINYAQRVLGIRFIVFFSSAFKGPKKNYNPNVRAENPR
jgi:hypothetical protein